MFPIEKEKTSRQLQAEATKEKILYVALEMVSKQGFDKVKIEDICKAAGVSTGAFYHHIKNKGGIVEGAYAQCDDYFTKVIRPQFATRTDISALGDYLSFQAGYAAEFGVALITQIYKAQLSDGTDFFLSPTRPLYQGVEDLILRMQEAKTLKAEKSAKAITDEVLMISRGIIYHWCLNKGQYNIEEMTKQMIQQFISGYVY